MRAARLSLPLILTTSLTGLTASQVDNGEGLGLITKCIAKDPMNERILNAVASAAPRAHLVDCLTSVLSHPVFLEEPLSDEAGAQLKRWQQYCITGTVAGGDPESFGKLLSIIAKAEFSRAVSMLRVISSSITSRKQKPPHAPPIQFAAKPAGLMALEQRSEPEIREQLKSISFMFTWPGLPTYGRKLTRQAPPLNKEEQARFERGKSIYRELCTTCHAPDGRGLKRPDGKGLLAPPLPESPRLEQNREAVIRIMLHGLTGELDGRKYEGLMAPFGATNDDEWVSSVLTYVRREWGNAGSTIQPSDVASAREKFKDRRKPWTQEELNWKLQRRK
jgi:mono/diheme cytochrome c family protein